MWTVDGAARQSLLLRSPPDVAHHAASAAACNTTLLLPACPRIRAVQTDIRMPKRHLRQLEDANFNGAWQAAIEAAVQVGGCGGQAA